MADLPKGSALRTLVSLSLLALVLVGLLGYTQLPALGGGDRPGTQEVAPVPAFHTLDRLGYEMEEGLGQCTACHALAAHGRDLKQRGFLNMHQGKIDCTACHLTGKGVAPHRFTPQGEPSKDPMDRIYAARRVEGKWTRLEAPDAPGGRVRMLERGPRCKECHRRRSTFLSTPGLFERFHRRLLEDLVVLRAMDGKI